METIVQVNGELSEATAVVVVGAFIFIAPKLAVVVFEAEVVIIDIVGAGEGSLHCLLNLPLFNGEPLSFVLLLRDQGRGYGRRDCQILLPLSRSGIPLLGWCVIPLFLSRHNIPLLFLGQLGGGEQECSQSLPDPLKGPAWLDLLPRVARTGTV